MDDDDDAMPWDSCATTTGVAAPATQGRQGQYQLPESGIYWVWHRGDGSGNLYDKLSVRDVGANQDLCVAGFKPIRCGTRLRGRRTNTAIPMEDLLVLKGEFTSGTARLDVQAGSLLDSNCLPSNCVLQDLEHALGMSTPWDVDCKHRLEISTAQSKRIGEHTVSVSGPASKFQKRHPSSSSFGGTAVALQTPVDSSEQQQVSMVETTIRCIAASLPLDNCLMEHLNNLSKWLQVPWFSSCLVPHFCRLGSTVPLFVSRHGVIRVFIKFHELLGFCDF
jgi:hypothetical protein